MPLPITTRLRRQHLGLTWRLGIVVAVLTVETLLMSYLIQKTPIDVLTGPIRAVRDTSIGFFASWLPTPCR